MKDLIDGRTNGTHWKSTRDSALAVLALSEYIVEKKIAKTPLRFDYAIDDEPWRTVDVPDVPFHPDSHLRLDSTSIASGIHAIRFRKPKGNRLNIDLNYRFLRKVNTIPAVSQGISIERTYRRIVKNQDDQESDANSKANSNTFEIGDIIEVQLRIRTKKTWSIWRLRILNQRAANRCSWKAQKLE